jgi:tryptophanyl-tRNA synthetase
MTARERVFSGIQPTGELHIGNYLGAVRNWVSIQDRYECIYSIVDYHAITIPFEVDRLQGRILELACGLLACGIDPARSTLFVQSEVPEHTELAWAFCSVAPMGELSRQTQFKSKSEQHPDSINAGIFIYPVLQAADVLLYKASLVPVGEDQEQHLELCREIARKFNARFGETFPEAHTMFSSLPRILGLDGKAKMSKSLGNTIAVDEEPAVVKKKLSQAFTDPNKLRRNDPGNPAICNIFTLHKSFSPPERVAEIDATCRSGALGCVECKRGLSEAMVAHFAPIRERWAELRADPGRVRRLLDEGRDRCRAIAAATMDEVRRKLGLRP